MGMIDSVDYGYVKINVAIEKEQLFAEATRAPFVRKVTPEPFNRKLSKMLCDSADSLEYIESNSRQTGGVLRYGKKNNVVTFQPLKKRENTIQTKLDFIKETFSLTNEQVALALKSTRKSLHNWSSSNSKPTKTKTKRILDLFDIAQQWNNAGYADLLKENDSFIIETDLMPLLNKDLLSLDEIMFTGSSAFLSNSPRTIEDPFA